VKKFDPKMAEKLIFFSKDDVNGSNAREVYRYMKPLAPNDDGSTDIRWNFAKFLVDREGNVVKRSTENPDSLKPDIEALLEKKASASS